MPTRYRPEATYALSRREALTPTPAAAKIVVNPRNRCWRYRSSLPGPSRSTVPQPSSVTARITGRRVSHAVTRSVPTSPRLVARFVCLIVAVVRVVVAVPAQVDAVQHDAEDLPLHRFDLVHGPPNHVVRHEADPDGQDHPVALGGQGDAVGDRDHRRAVAQHEVEGRARRFLQA